MKKITRFFCSTLITGDFLVEASIEVTNEIDMTMKRKFDTKPETIEDIVSLILKFANDAGV